MESFGKDKSLFNQRFVKHDNEEEVYYFQVWETSVGWIGVVFAEDNINDKRLLIFKDKEEAGTFMISAFCGCFGYNLNIAKPIRLEKGE